MNIILIKFSSLAAQNVVKSDNFPCSQCKNLHRNDDISIWVWSLQHYSYAITCFWRYDIYEMTVIELLLLHMNNGCSLHTKTIVDLASVMYVEEYEQFMIIAMSFMRSKYDL